MNNTKYIRLCVHKKEDGFIYFSIIAQKNVPSDYNWIASNKIRIRSSASPQITTTVDGFLIFYVQGLYQEHHHDVLVCNSYDFNKIQEAISEFNKEGNTYDIGLPEDLFEI